MAKRKRNRTSTKVKAADKAAQTCPTVSKFLRPTESREAHNDFAREGMSYRAVPVIETMLRAGQLTPAQFDNLMYYRDQAHRAQDDCAQDGTLSPERIMGGVSSSPGGGKIPAILLGTPAILECARIEREIGSLIDIARAVAVNDVTLTRWCIERHGGRERYNGKGEFVAMVPIAEKRVMAEALLELRFAAGRFCR